MQVEQWCRNFIWTGDILNKGITIVNWTTICSPLENGGLRILTFTMKIMHIFLSLLGTLLIATGLGLWF